MNENMVPVFMGHLIMMMMILLTMIVMMMMIQCDTCLSVITLIMLENKVGSYPFSYIYTCNHSNTLNENMVPVFMGHLIMMMMILLTMIVMMMMIQCDTCLNVITLIMLENKVGTPSHDT